MLSESHEMFSTSETTSSTSGKILSAADHGNRNGKDRSTTKTIVFVAEKIFSATKTIVLVIEKIFSIIEKTV